MEEIKESRGPCFEWSSIHLGASLAQVNTEPAGKSMKYRRNKKGEPISQLGYGCMRFSRKLGGVDFDKTEKELLKAYEMGVNYFDTAYIYPGSEECLGNVLKKNNLREKVNVATKLPQYLMRSNEQIEKTFREELSRLQTDYIDFYLMHMFTDISEWEHLKSLGIEDWIASHKADGSIRNIGFSYHGNTEMFLKILNAYDWDFCQIQYNYLDEYSQAGRPGLQAAGEKGIPVVIMEPLRGGKLVNLPTSAAKICRENGRGCSPAELGLRWLWNQPQIMCVLSGMNSLEMVEENCRVASEAEIGGFTEEDQEVVDKIKAFFREKEKVGCTACRYCMPCPKGVDIPGIFYYYNMMYMEKKNTARREFAQVMSLRESPGFATQCIKCGKCEMHCPQSISIREKLQEADKALRPWPFKLGASVARKIMIK